jgi:predicted P-loop ATPase
MELRLYLFYLWNMCCFIVGSPLDVEFEMKLEADAVVWCSDIDLVMIEDWLQDFEGRYGN